MRDKIILKLKKNNDKYVSGEMLSEQFGVTRTAIWKHIKELRNEGFVIESCSNKGYKLVSAPDVISAYEIGLDLNTKFLGKDIKCFKELDSTNNYAKKLANEGCEDGLVILADSQTSGRGRLGRTWSSIPNKGIWMSIVLKPSIAPEDVQIFTLAAAVAVVNAIKDITGICAGIKWPNDIILDEKKVCGILTEMNSEIEKVNYMVLGVGINVNHELDDFNDDISNTAISLKIYNEKKQEKDGSSYLKESFNRNQLMRCILQELDVFYAKINEGKTEYVLDKWRERSITLGKQVTIISRNEEFKGIAKDITDEGRLIVYSEDGTHKEVLSGEVSIRGIMGYA